MVFNQACVSIGRAEEKLDGRMRLKGQYSIDKIRKKFIDPLFGNVYTLALRLVNNYSLVPTYCN